MTKLLEKALEKVSKLSRDEQDAIASQILGELEDEAQWAKQFAASKEKLRLLAEEALAEDHRGETLPLDDLRCSNRASFRSGGFTPPHGEASSP
jgi:hypothetical protein